MCYVCVFLWLYLDTPLYMNKHGKNDNCTHLKSPSLSLAVACRSRPHKQTSNHPPQGVVCVRAVMYCVRASSGVRVSYVMARVVRGRNMRWGILCARARVTAKCQGYTASTPGTPVQRLNNSEWTQFIYSTTCYTNQN